jgi:hypothetical protein
MSALRRKRQVHALLEFILVKAVLIPISVSEAAGKVKTIVKTPSDFRLFENQLAFARNT